MHSNKATCLATLSYFKRLAVSCLHIVKPHFQSGVQQLLTRHLFGIQPLAEHLAQFKVDFHTGGIGSLGYK